MEAPTVVWLVRHAETSTPAIFHGAESDIDLSDLGLRQADAAAGWFRDRAPTVVISSGMRRARDTAAPIAAACGVPHLIEPDLHERRVGILSGTAFSTDAGPWADTIRRWQAGETAYSTEGAESFDELRSRLLPPIARLAQAHHGGRVVVVAHGGVCKVLLLCLLSEYGPADWTRIGKIANLSASELVFAGGAWSANQLLHIPEPVAALTAGQPTGIGGRSVG